MNQALEKLDLLFSEAKKNPESSSEELFLSFWPLSVSLTRQERTETATRIHEWAKSIVNIQPVTLAYATLTLCQMSFQNEQYEQALEYGSEAQKLFSALADEDGEAMCIMFFGNIYRPLGNVELALKYLLDAYPKICKAGKYKFFQCTMSFNLAEIYSDTNHLDESLKLYDDTISVANTNRYTYIEGLATNGTACVYLKQKKYGLATEFFNKALDISKQMNFPLFQARVLTDFGDYYRISGDYEHAIENNKEALSMRESLQNRGGVITNLMNIGEINTIQSKKDEAIKDLEKALILAEELNIKPKIFRIHELLSGIYLAGNELSKSLFHYKAYHEIRDIVNDEDREKKVKNLQIIFEAEQTKKENTIIKAQKAEIERKNLQLQNTIDELTRTRASRRAKAITLIVAIGLFVMEEVITELILHPNLPENNFLISLGANGVIVFSLKPIENGIEHYLLHHRFALKGRIKNARTES